MSADKVCHECGATGKVMAQASRGRETRYFCHDEERSCYNYRRGRYFEDHAVQTNPYRGIRKVRKAQWVYECRACDFRSRPSVDLFGAVEAKSRHMRTSAHVFKAMDEALNSLTEAFTAMVAPVNEALDQITKLFAPPPNMPHDPSLLRDKRKWGGK